jgi:hypothetical protein
MQLHSLRLTQPVPNDNAALAADLQAAKDESVQSAADATCAQAENAALAADLQAARDTLLKTATDAACAFAAELQAVKDAAAQSAVDAARAQADITALVADLQAAREAAASGDHRHLQGQGTVARCMFRHRKREVLPGYDQVTLQQLDAADKGSRAGRGAAAAGSRRQSLEGPPRRHSAKARRDRPTDEAIRGLPTSGTPS